MLLLTTFLACSGNRAPADPVTSSTEPVEAVEPVDTGWAPGDNGVFQLWTDVNTGITEGGAVAVRDSPGYVNLVECLVDPVSKRPCLPELPKADGEWLDFDPGERVERDRLQTRYLGPEVSFGPVTLDFVQDAESGAIIYAGPTDATSLDDREIGPAWGDFAWPAYQGDADIRLPSPVALVRPQPGSVDGLTSGEDLVIEWVPGDEPGTFVTLEVLSRFGFARVFRLDDDGLFTLDVDTLPWASTIQEADFRLTRWHREGIRRFGNTIDLLATSYATWTGQYLFVGSRDLVVPADTCAEAGGAPSLGAGRWWWRTAGATNGVTDCGGPGPDAIFRVDLPSQMRLVVEITVHGENVDGILGLATACPSDVDTCLAVDDQPGSQRAEYANTTDDARPIHVFADMRRDPFNPPRPVFVTMDVQILPL